MCMNNVYSHTNTHTHTHTHSYTYIHTCNDYHYVIFLLFLTLRQYRAIVYGSLLYFTSFPSSTYIHQLLFTLLETVFSLHLSFTFSSFIYFHLQYFFSSYFFLFSICFSIILTLINQRFPHLHSA